MFLYYVIAALSILLYLHGFFPIPTRGFQTVFPNDVTLDSSKYQRGVLIVIDALRLDFVSDTTTPFLAKTYKNTGCFIQLKVETPTVTLPRIKALTTGNMPQFKFVDIILNLASPTKVDDSFIHRAHARGKKIVFYGDDIWIKLFPDLFERSEGTSSFFVNDFTEVDDNVTRNVKMEIEKNDWDLMVLHYLGLDHIGHVYGPKSPLILTKLKEMDSIIEQIYNKAKDNTLFFITGDHGMRDSGGHGGSTYPETNVPLVVLGLPCTNDTFAQIDFPANLAILLGFDIPVSSIGQLQQSLLSHLPLADFVKALKYNTLFLRNKADLCEENIATANHFLDLFLMNHIVELGTNAAKMYQNCAQKISERLLKISVRQTLESLVIATLISVTVVLKILQTFFGIKHNTLELFAMLAILVLQFLQIHSILTFLLVVITCFLTFKNLTRLKMKHLRQIDTSFLTVLSILHPWSFLSSSFLEEEHQFWYFFTNTFIFLNILKNVNTSKFWFLLFVCIRLIRMMNQVGDKWASVPDLADWLLQNRNYFFLQIIFIFGLALAYFSSRPFTKHTVGNFIDLLVLFLIYIFRTFFNESVVLGQILWFSIFIKFVFCTLTKEGFLPVWMLTITLLLKPHNVVLIPVCLLASRLFHKLLKNEVLIMAHWWLGNLLFFAQGHDNSLASVDISSGYIGLSEYEPILVFPQVLCHTYALPVLSHLLLFTNKKIDIFKSLSMFVLFRLYTVVLVFVITFIHRHHLFIWSVFAPKMFVEASHFAFLFIEISCHYLRDVINKISN